MWDRACWEGSNILYLAVADSSGCSVAMSICVWGRCARLSCVCGEMQASLKCTLSGGKVVDGCSIKYQS